MEHPYRNVNPSRTAVLLSCRQLCLRHGGTCGPWGQRGSLLSCGGWRPLQQSRARPHCPQHPAALRLLSPAGRRADGLPLRMPPFPRKPGEKNPQNTKIGKRSSRKQDLEQETRNAPRSSPTICPKKTSSQPVCWLSSQLRRSHPQKIKNKTHTKPTDYSQNMNKSAGMKPRPQRQVEPQRSPGDAGGWGAQPCGQSWPKAGPKLAPCRRPHLCTSSPPCRKPSSRQGPPVMPPGLTSAR